MAIGGIEDNLGARPLRLGMIGGGQGAFIGAIHRFAARLDGHFGLVAGALSSDPDRALASARQLGIADDRSYGDYREMAKQEADREDGIEVVAIVTPNHLHMPNAVAFLEAGIDVICDKPLTSNLKDAIELESAVSRTGRVFVLTQNNTGYAMVRHARHLVASGALGKIRHVQVSYAQEWLSQNIDAQGHKQAEWRTDPARSGPGGTIVDIGVHGFNLAEFVTGLKIESVAADLATYVPGRRVDDSAQILCRYEGEVKGAIWASQVAPGNNNNISIKVFGELAGLEWHGEHADELRFARIGEPPQIMYRGGPGGDSDPAVAATRMPAGLNEGYIEGFANIYADAAELIRARQDGRDPSPEAVTVPQINEGMRGMRFIEAAAESGRRDAAWAPLEQ